MSLTSMSNLSSQKSSLCPTYALIRYLINQQILPAFSNGRQAVGDGAAIFDNDSNVLAICQLQGAGNLYYYSTTFSGGPGVRPSEFTTRFMLR